jgi:hypothetical protein
MSRRVRRRAQVVSALFPGNRLAGQAAGADRRWAAARLRFGRVDGPSLAATRMCADAGCSWPCSTRSGHLRTPSQRGARCGCRSSHAAGNYKCETSCASRCAHWPPVDGPALAARYDAPDDTFADLENALFYNVGMAVFAPLIIGGLTCQRGRSRDTYHDVEYRSVAQPPQRGRVPYTQIHADLGTRLPTIPGSGGRPYTTS